MRMHHRVRAGHDGLCSQADAVQRRERHCQCVAVTEADDFTGGARTAPADDFATRADRDAAVQARDFDEQALDSGDAPKWMVGGEALQFGGEAFHGGSCRHGREVPDRRPACAVGFNVR